MAARITINGTPLSDEHAAALTSAVRGYLSRIQSNVLLDVLALLNASRLHDKSGMVSSPPVYSSSNALHIDQAPMVVYEDATPLAYFACGNCTACANPVAAARGSHFYCAWCGHGEHFHYIEEVK